MDHIKAEITDITVGLKNLETTVLADDRFEEVFSFAIQQIIDSLR